MVKTWILAVVLGAIAIAPFLYLAYYMIDVRNSNRRASLAVVEFQPQIKPTSVEVGATFMVMSVNIHDGYRFSLDLEGAVDIEAHLPVATKEKAIPVIIELLNNATPPPPTVTLLRHVDEQYWIVDIQLTKDGKRESLVDHLRRNDLLLDH